MKYEVQYWSISQEQWYYETSFDNLEDALEYAKNTTDGFSYRVTKVVWESA